jgi:hypothetical protein
MKRPILILIIVFICCGEFSCTNINSSDDSKLIWDFSKQKVYVYSYSKKQDTKNKTGINNNYDQKYMKRDGRFYIQSTDKLLAHLIYPNALTSLSLYDEKTKSIDTMSFINVGFTKYNIKPNECFIDSDSLILFPQFSKKLEKGSKDTLQTYFKFNSPIAMLLANGYNIVEYIGDTIFENQKCVMIKGKFGISNIVLPKDFSSNLKIS